MNFWSATCATQIYDNPVHLLCARYTVYVEMACNGLLGVGQNGMIAPTDPDRHFTLQRVDIATFDRDVYSLLMDMDILHGMAKVIPRSLSAGVTRS